MCPVSFSPAAKKEGNQRASSPRISLAASWREKIKMKRITIALLCISGLALSALAQDKPADNSARNQRDRSGETKTSGDQSNSADDLKITAAIRRSVVKNDSLTATAKNVKIITAGGMVTLRGPVLSADEKSVIEKLARAAAPSAKIDNQLEVKQER